MMTYELVLAGGWFWWITEQHHQSDGCYASDR